MMFRPDLARLILRGKKTQTRRRAKPDQTVCPYTVGKDYAVCPGRGKPAIGRILITDTRIEFLGDLTQRDAIAEGFKTRPEFADYWLRLYDPRWAKHRQDLALGDQEPVVLERFAKIVDTPVWVITFQRDTTDHPRLLRARMGSVSDYTENRMLAATGEPEAVTPAEQARITAGAHERDEQLQADAVIRARREIEQQLRILEETLHPNEHTSRRLEVCRRELRLLDRDLKAA